MTVFFAADHSIPVELSLTSKLIQKAGDVKTFSGNPIGLFIGKYYFAIHFTIKGNTARLTIFCNRQRSPRHNLLVPRAAIKVQPQ